MIFILIGVRKGPPRVNGPRPTSTLKHTNYSGGPLRRIFRPFLL